jgi:peptidoglycan/xylan/chitin deacetylase (PgdA/CDA1 family)
MNRAAVTGLAKRVLFEAGHYSRALAERRFPGIAVLCYHAVLPAGQSRTGIPFAQLHVAADTFAAHCALLAAHCHPVSLAQAEAIWSGEAESPARPVLVTFDDGHHALRDHALPALRLNGVPATVFVCTAPVTQGTPFWFDALARAAGEGAVEEAKALDYDHWRARTELTAAPPAADPVAPLTEADIAVLAAEPLVTLGAHTLTHPILARASHERQLAEIAGSLLAVRTWTGRAPTAFAYPNGRPGIDYNADTLAILREAGVTAAFTTADGWATREEPALERSRFMMLDSIDVAELAHRLCYAWM